MNDHKKACELGEAALSEALEKIDDVDEETFRDAKSIIELLKENLSLWKEEEGDNAVEDLWDAPVLEMIISVWILCTKFCLPMTYITDKFKDFEFGNLNVFSFDIHSNYNFG